MPTTDPDRDRCLDKLVGKIVIDLVITALIGLAGFSMKVSDGLNPATSLMPVRYLWVEAVVPPLVYLFIRSFFWRMRGVGKCQGCGYDMRASSVQCPECGRMVKRSDAEI